MSACILAFVKRHAFCTFSTPYCHVYLVRLYHIPLHYLRNDTIKKKVCFECLKLLYATFLNIRRIQRDIIAHLKRSSCKVSAIPVRY